MTYELFLEEYKRRRSVWQRVCRVLFTVFMLAGLFSLYFVIPLVRDVSIFSDDSWGFAVLAGSAFVVIVASLCLLELLINVLEFFLERSYLKSYVVVDIDDTKLVYGFIRDADRTRFQLKLQKSYPSYELDLNLAVEKRCTFALVNRERWEDPKSFVVDNVGVD
ncbi:hypothetical protein [Vibrio owensii]|uniref:hypothetical protein n=1 Tax=Vibrio owensii TaxID=696485 RepID=UPI0018F17986|nr:hypothetical protein [Vibrio owensii]